MQPNRWNALIIALVAAVLLPSLAYAQGRQLPGAIWTFKAVNGSEVVEGQYRVYRKEVFRGNRKVGVVKPKSANVTTLEITGFPKLNGTTILNRTKGPHWEGTLKRDDGSKWVIDIDIKE